MLAAKRSLKRHRWLRVQAVSLLVGAAMGLTTVAAADDVEFSNQAAPLLQKFCFECHGNEGAEADLNLQQLASTPSFASDFKAWEKVLVKLGQQEMPPEEMPQPSDAQRQQIVTLIRQGLLAAAKSQQGDPGQVPIRRLTSAEYAYTIRDLTGLDIDFARHFVSDAVGGEGFTNVGAVQFVEDATLQRYLEAAKQVAAHAVIGAGPLQFHEDPGRTGLELSAIKRIQNIYRRHGFRTGAGEGGEPFGLDRYPKAFLVTWRYLHRERLGIGDATLAGLAAAEGLDRRFVDHIWSVLNAEAHSSPSRDIVARWRSLPAPDPSDSQLQHKVRAACEDLYRYLHGWQSLLADSINDREEAAVLTGKTIRVTRKHSFRVNVEWPETQAVARVRLNVAPIAVGAAPKTIVIWKNPQVRFRRPDKRWKDAQPLSALVSDEKRTSTAFGLHPAGASIDADDFVTVDAASADFDLPVPEGVTAARFTAEVQLDVAHGDDCIARISIRADEQGRAVSALLGDPNGDAAAAWQAPVREFARQLPAISHREPAPSDRDPIPFPYDNSYNNPERNEFHYQIKYHRDDRFLVDKILDDATRARLDEAWTDLLGSFDYHDRLLQFFAKKYDLELDGRHIGQLDESWLKRLPAEQQTYLQRLGDDYAAVRSHLQSAESRHLDDIDVFATRAWRHPLSGHEQRDLRVFYAELRQRHGLGHQAAIRALLARILVAPAFLYRVERPANTDEAVALSQWELASRLSYLVWSSLPDVELSRAAARGALRSPDEIARQARRMLRDPKARRLAREFFGQWLGFYQFDRYRGVDPQRFPEFTDRLRSAMHQEAVTFFAHIVREDRPVREILFADYAFLDGELAGHYGIDVVGASPESFQRVAGVDRFHRGGLLGLGAVLTVTSAPLRTSPVKRGDWILRRILGTPVPPPPPDAGSIAADDSDSDGLTVRERLETHRRDASCSNCHARIDPLGFALEHYDAIGRWRDHYRGGHDIDATGTLGDGTHISGVQGLHGYLEKQEEQFQRTLCVKLLGYALGRGELASDRHLLEQMTSQLDDGNGRFSDLVVQIVTSRQFRYHRGRDD